MKQFVTIRLAFVLLVGTTLLFSHRLAAEPSLLDGPQLARAIRELIPEKNAELSATMEVVIRERKRFNTEVVIQIEKLGQAKWRTIYKANLNGESPEQWTVHHQLGQPNCYEDNTGTTKRPDIYSAFAGSSLYIADLGMDFLHWPNQVIVKTQRRKSRLCYVLESRNPEPTKGEYHRVVSWVDKKSGGILLADIYTAESKPVKRFAVKGLTKKDGLWQVDEIEMRDIKSRERSRLHFHLK